MKKGMKKSWLSTVVMVVTFMGVTALSALGDGNALIYNNAPGDRSMMSMSLSTDRADSREARLYLELTQFPYAYGWYPGLIYYYTLDEMNTLTEVETPFVDRYYSVGEYDVGEFFKIPLAGMLPGYYTFEAYLKDRSGVEIAGYGRTSLTFIHECEDNTCDDFVRNCEEDTELSDGLQCGCLRPSYAFDNPCECDPAYRAANPCICDPAYHAANPCICEPGYASDYPCECDPAYRSANPCICEPGYASDYPCKCDPAYAAKNWCECYPDDPNCHPIDIFISKCGEVIEDTTGNIEEHIIDLKQSTGFFDMEYFTDTAEDKIEIFNDRGQLLYTTGCVQMSGNLKHVFFDTQKIHVRLTDCSGNGGTNWWFKVACPVPVNTCNTDVESGSNELDIKEIELGQTSGYFGITYDTRNVEDNITIEYDGVLCYESDLDDCGSTIDLGCEGTNGNKTVKFYYEGVSSVIKVIVKPNCKGSSDTYWEYKISCPEDLP